MPKLNNEAERIYYAIFSKKIPLKIQDHFIIIADKIETRFTEEEIGKYNKYINKISDLEALEFAARCFRKLPVLTLKFKIMFYLAETVPENYPRFINEKDAFLLGTLSLIASLFRSSYKLIKGTCLLIIYRI